MSKALGLLSGGLDSSLAALTLKRQGIEVRRYNLAQEPVAFTARPEVAKILRETDGNGLPIILVDGNVVSHGLTQGEHDGDSSCESGRRD